MKFESIRQFYTRYSKGIDFAADSYLRAVPEFAVHRREDFPCDVTLPNARRDFFKISLLVGGGGILDYGSKSFQITSHALVFSSPIVPFSWTPSPQRQKGFVCLFSPNFLIHDRVKNGGLLQLPMFGISGTPVCLLTDRTTEYLETIFEKLMEEERSDYPHKVELLRSYVQIIIHEGLKSATAEASSGDADASSRIAVSFLERLESQFPVTGPGYRLAMRTAQRFAEEQGIHANHLNFAVKQVTGRTISQHIAKRIYEESVFLLREKDWTVSEIAYSLGFEHAPNFSIFFKKHSGLSPVEFRQGRSGRVLK